MQYAERLPTPKSMVAPVVALAIGAAAATGTYALIDSDQVTFPEPKVIVSETPAPTSPSLAAKHEATTAAAIARHPGAVGSTGTTAAVGIPSPAAAAKMNGEAGTGTASKDEAGTAAAVGNGASEDEDPFTSRTGCP